MVKVLWQRLHTVEMPSIWYDMHAWCGKKHHFTAMCKTQDVHLVECDEDEHSHYSDNDEPFYLETIEVEHDGNKHSHADYSDDDKPFYIETIESSSDRPNWKLAITSNNVKFDVKIDTGASVMC